MIDPLRQKRHLHIGGTSVPFMELEFTDGL
jgi:hypothetical protein